ncbi:gp53-like domain-containing protein [Escherichia coli]|uniref:gp53-like domain-containing protein n=1 Tax=Escherichia coli TaxID=562 RepID=UPI0021F0F969|nr:hypothetical protein [Escherichia coli]MCV4306167.1 hypothetical protein [Escherichia coli]
MAINNFKAFALDPNANVMSQADWEALPALLSGFTAGKAASAQVNKAIRQATTIGALIGQFIANSGADALDNADVNGLVTKFTNALTANLSLGNASKRDVGTGANQIPDMNSFASTRASSGYQKLPSGVIVQWGAALAGVGSTAGTGNTVSFPVAFPNYCAQILTSYDNGGGAVVAGAAGNQTTTQFLLRCDASGGSYNFRWFAVGY